MTDQTRRGIRLDPESVRTEAYEAPDAHDLTPEQAEAFDDFTDEEIASAINNEVDDDFWAAYDDVRARVISRLTEGIAPADEE